MSTSLAYSCEPGRRKAYQVDLRWRMVWQRLVQGFSLQVVACNLSVDPSTVQRVCKKFELVGTVEKKKYICSNHPLKKLTKPVQFVLLHLVLRRPGIYLTEIQQELFVQLGLKVSAALICNFLKKSNFTRKKMQLIAAQRDEDVRSTFVIDVTIYVRRLIVFIDETGCDRRNAIQRYAYGLRGKPVRCQKLLVRGEHISAIAAMSVEGLLEVKIVRGGVTGEIFDEFVNKQLLFHLMSFNGSNPNSIVIMDNCSIHHTESVAQSFDDIGVIVHYLPPYSPDYNPIELLFSKVKYLIKRMEVELSAVEDIETIVLTAFAAVTKEDCEAWINCSGIYN